MFHTFLSKTGLLAVARFCLYTLAFLLPLFFLPISLDPLEFNKQTLLLILALLAVLAWVGSVVRERTLSLRRGWIHLLPLLVVLATVLSAFWSQWKYVSWAGTSLQEYQSVFTVIALALVFYLVVHVWEDAGARRKAMILLLLSSDR